MLTEFRGHSVGLHSNRALFCALSASCFNFVPP